MSIPNQVLQRFEDHKNNPMVQAIRRYIIEQLRRPLAHVASWGIEVSDKRVRTFYVRFTDGTIISGEIEEAWTVRVYEP